MSNHDGQGARAERANKTTYQLLLVFTSLSEASQLQARPTTPDQMGCLSLALTGALAGHELAG